MEKNLNNIDFRVKQMQGWIDCALEDLGKMKTNDSLYTWKQGQIEAWLLAVKLIRGEFDGE